MKVTRYLTAYSVYEVFRDGKHWIRRLAGVNDPTPAIGTDGEWREAERIYQNTDEPSYGLVIHWGGTRVTWTSPINAFMEVEIDDSALPGERGSEGPVRGAVEKLLGHDTDGGVRNGAGSN